MPFGLGLLLITVIHAVRCVRVPNASARAIHSNAPYTVASAGLVLAAAFVAGPAHWALWGVSVAVLLVATLRRQEQAFEPAQVTSWNGTAC